MLNYELFKQMTDQLLPQCLPEQYTGLKPYPFTRHVNNCADKEGFSFEPDQYPVSGSYAVPVCYYSDLYEHYVKDNVGTDQLGTWMKDEMASLFEKVEMEAPAAQIGSRIKVLDPSNIYIDLVNTEANQDFLDGVPHREFMDLSVTYRYLVGYHNEHIQDISITDEFAERLGMDENQLYDAAIENTPRIFPFSTQWITEMLDLNDMEEEFGDMPPRPNMLYLSTESGLHGPNALLYPEVLEAASAKVGGDAFIIPSSIYELLLVSADGMDGEFVANMVTEVNAEQLAPADRLSNGAYFYDSRSRTLSPVTDTVVPLSESIGNVRPLPAPNPSVFQQNQRSPRI